MFEKNATPQFRLPFYRTGEKRFPLSFSKVASKIVFPSITMELDFAEVDERDSGNSRNRR